MLQVEVINGHDVEGKSVESEDEYSGYGSEAGEDDMSCDDEEDLESEIEESAGDADKTEATAEEPTAAPHKEIGKPMVP